MALWHCSACTTAYSVGAPRCPHCGSTDYLEDSMAKIHADGTVTDATVLAEDVRPKRDDAVEVHDDPAPERPAGNASTAEWAAYALARGHDRGDVDGLSRAELIELVDADPDAV